MQVLTSSQLQSHYPHNTYIIKYNRVGLAHMYFYIVGATATFHKAQTDTQTCLSHFLQKLHL